MQSISLSQRCEQWVESSLFQNTVIFLIVATIILVGLEGFPELYQAYGHWIEYAHYAILGLFTIELIIRIGSYGKRPHLFFTNAWNIFDFLIIALCYVPHAQFTSVLRMLRILRAVRLVAYAHKLNTEKQLHKELKSAYADLEHERSRSDWLLHNILPQLIANRLKGFHQDSTQLDKAMIADSFDETTVLFADIVGFTQISKQVSPEELVSLLNQIFSRFDTLVEKHQVEKIKTIGDAYMVVAGVPEADPKHLHNIANLALDMLKEMEKLRKELELNIQVRIGFHTGAVVAGVIGHKRFIYDLWGDTVNIASRLESHGTPRHIHIAEDTWELLKDSYVFEKRGTVELKGRGEMTTYYLKGLINQP